MLARPQWQSSQVTKQEDGSSGHLALLQMHAPSQTPQHTFAQLLDLQLTFFIIIKLNVLFVMKAQYENGTDRKDCKRVMLLKS
jgi:hypothetical protein